MFKGYNTALITPFKDGKVDEGAFRSHVEWQIGEGIHGLVPCGTTGESPTLSHEEHMRVTELCVEIADGRVPVIAGTGSNSTEEAIRLTRHAKEAGAAGALMVTPYYNKPTQEGMYRHFSAVADAVDIPIVIYNIPGRSVVDMTVETMARLAKHANIAGVKDATADLVRPVLTRLAIGADFCQLTGEDATAVPFVIIRRRARSTSPSSGTSLLPSSASRPQATSAITSTFPGASLRTSPLVATMASGTWQARANSAWAARWRRSPWTGTATSGRTHWYMRMSSSWLGWPETWTKWVRSEITSTPSPTSWFCNRKITRSLPGMIREEKMTVSPGSSATWGWSPAAIRASAERGSPWLPVQASRTLSRGSKPASWSFRKATSLR